MILFDRIWRGMYIRYSHLGGIMNKEQIVSSFSDKTDAIYKFWLVGTYGD